MKNFSILLLLVTALATSNMALSNQPLKVAIIGLTHDHVHGLLNQLTNSELKIVAIVEPNRELASRYSAQYHFPMELVYPTIDEMLKTVTPEAVCAFNSIYEHLEVVQKCAPKGIHVMVEKPLAVNLKAAREMEALATKYHIQLLTNYETTWYASNHETYNLVNNKKTIGDIRKVVVHDGHRGPKEIGCSKEFLEWLTDPVLNGGGAIIDFGCYGANLITWLMNGERPISVTAITLHNKPELYPKVDDEATILVTYPKAEGIVQASWNWPFNRKDMEVYGQTGYVMADNSTDIRYKYKESEPEAKQTLPARTAPLNDPFSMFKAVVRGEMSLPTNDLSSLENNLLVVEILDAARESAKTGKTIFLNRK